VTSTIYMILVVECFFCKL